MEYDDDSNDDTEDNTDCDVDVSVDVEATPDNVDAMLGTQTVDFTPGDVVGKLMAFINQVRLCNTDTADFLKDQCISQGCCVFKLKLWVRTCWGSLYSTSVRCPPSMYLYLND